MIGISLTYSSSMTRAILRIFVVGAADKTRVLMPEAIVCPADGPGELTDSNSYA